MLGRESVGLESGEAHFLAYTRNAEFQASLPQHRFPDATQSDA